MANYITIEEADIYFANRLFTDPWDSAITINRTKALTQATMIINHLPFIGEKSNDDQDNAFPRLIITNDGETILDTPQAIKDACAEIAIKLLDGYNPEEEYENALLKLQSYGNIRLEYLEVYPEHIIAGVPSITAWRYLRPYLNQATNIGINRV